MATKAKENEKQESSAETQDGPLLDLSASSVKKMIRAAKKRGYVTYEVLNEVLPSDQVSSEQIEDVMAMLSEMGISVIEEDEAEEREAEKESTSTELTVATGTAVASKSNAREGSDRTDDPVRMYLREMGTVELLSREGEIAIAKRIEAGRETMIEGLCESPLTFQAIIIWREQLAEGEILLRDIIDLEATYAGPDAKEEPTIPAEGEAHKPAGEENKAEEKTGEEGESNDDDDDDDDEFENNLSLSAMEAELKPQVVETFDLIANTYAKLRKLHDEQVEQKLASSTLTDKQLKKLNTLKAEVIAEVKSLSLHNGRIEALVEQLYDINKGLVRIEGRLLRLAESYGIQREDFLSEYHGNELAPDWVDTISTLPKPGWTNFAVAERDMIEELREEIKTLATETGMDIAEYRKIVHKVQKGEREAAIAKKKKWLRRTCAS